MKAIVFLSILTVVFTPYLSSNVDAHGTGGFVEREVGEYIVDFGYSDQFLKSGANNLFDIQLLKQSDRSQVEFDQLWLKFTQGNNTVYTANLLPQKELKKVLMTYALPTSGEHTVSVQYFNQGQKVVEDSFTVNVEGSSERLRANPFVSFIIGLIIGVLAPILINRFAKRKT